MYAKGYYACLSLFALLFSTHIIASPITPLPPTCFKHTNPLKPNQKIQVPCGEIVSETPPSTLLDYSVTRSGKFQLMFSCIPPGTPSCSQAKAAFRQAFSILESYLILKANIVVNASFLNFCTARGECGADGFQILGGAAPANSVQLEDSDGISRMYPQALLKQLDVSSHPKYEPVDIFCEFNAAAEFHFPSDPTPTKHTQADMLFVVLHELTHGLGFTSAWDDYVNSKAQSLTPAITGATDDAGQFEFRGFVENVFDKFMIETATGRPMSSRTTALNKLFENSPTYPSHRSFLSALQASQAANALGVAALKLATTAKSLAFRTSDGRTMMLETSLSPYDTGSSVSHADLKTFTNTPDYLMRFRVDSGVSLASATESGGGGPLGPVLLSVLETLGYATADNPHPILPPSLSHAATVPPSRIASALVLFCAFACSSYLR